MRRNTNLARRIGCLALKTLVRMKQLLLFLCLLAVSCQKSTVPASVAVEDRLSGDGCESDVVVKSISEAPFQVQLIGTTWCLESAAHDDRLVPCAWTWDPQLQIAGKKILLTGDYPQWTPSPNARHIGRPFKVKGMKAAE